MACDTGRKRGIPADPLQLLFVLGCYAENQESRPDEIAPYMIAMQECGLATDWAVCASGQAETASLREAFRRGGKARVGFENGLWNEDGRVAHDNAERVQELARVRIDVADFA